MRTIAENIVDALIVTLGLDSSEYQQGMDEAERSTREFSEKAPREAERGLNQIEQKFGGAFRGIFHSFIAPLTAALGTMGIFSSYTQTADRIGKTANRIGASAEDLQAFGEAAKRAGGSVEGFMGAFESLNGQLQRMQAMGGKGRITPILKQLGISATDNGQVKDTFQILRELAGASERLGKQKFAGLARFLGLDQGTIMLLQQGRIALDEVIKRQKELGVYTKQDFEITAKFNDAISDLTQSFKQLAAPILRVITPALTTVANWLTKIAQTFREHQGFIVAGLTVIAGVMSGTLLKAAVALGAALKPLLAPIAAIAALGAIFDEIAVYAEGGETAFEGLWRAIGTPEEYRAVGKAISETFNGALQTVKDFAKEAGDAFVDLVQKWGESFDPKAFVESVKSAWNGIKKALEPLNDAFTPMKDAAKSLLSALGEITSLAASAVKNIAEMFSPELGGSWDLLHSISEFIANAVSGIADGLKVAFDWIGKIAASLRESVDAGALVEGLTSFGEKLKDAFAPLKDVFEPLKTAASALWDTLGEVLNTAVALGEKIVEIFSPSEPGEQWSLLKTAITAISDALSGIAEAAESAFKFLGNAAKEFRAMLDGDVFDGLKGLTDSLTSAFSSVISTAGELLGLVTDIAKAVLSIFTPSEPGDGWASIKNIVDTISLALKSLLYVVEQVFNWVGDLAQKAREAINAFGFIETVKKWVDDLFNAIAGLFNPGAPGSEWSALRAIIDGIKSGIDLMIGAVKDLLAWVEKVIRGIRSWWNSGENDNAANEQAVSAVTGGKPKEQYIAEQAAEIKKANPRLTDKEAVETVERQLSFNAALKRDYDTFGGDRLSLESMGYRGADIDALEKAMSKQAQAPAPVQKEQSSGWWASLFGGNGKASDTAAATVGSKAADKTEFSQDNRKTISVKYDTNVTNNNTFNGVERSAEVRDAVARGSREGTERGLSSYTPAVDTGVF